VEFLALAEDILSRYMRVERGPMASLDSVTALRCQSLERAGLLQADAEANAVVMLQAI
jgi:hypothetical protein